MVFQAISYLENVVANVIDLNGWRAVVAHCRIEHVLETWRCRDEDDFMTVNYFVFNSVKWSQLNAENLYKIQISGIYLNITSLNSELFTNLRSIRDPLMLCGVGSSIVLMPSGPKDVVKMSANRSLVTSFWWKMENYVVLLTVMNWNESTLLERNMLNINGRHSLTNCEL